MKRTPYFFEVFLALNTAFVFWFARAEAVPTILHSIASVAGVATVAASAGLGVRFLVAWRQHHARRLLRIVTSREWLIDSVRIFIGLSMLGISYAWIKLLVPVLHPHVYDQELFALDQKLCFGISPSIFFLQLFSSPRFLRLIDVAYIQFFIVGMMVSFGVFFSSPVRRIRIAFMTSSALMWLIGAWTYVLIPSFGPAFRFPEVWFPYAQYLKWTQATQAALMRNYVNLIRMAHGQKGKIFLELGIGAFPSLHVATQSLVAIWFNRVWRGGTILFAGAAFFVFIGSMITGWHYLVDGIAGVALAYGSYAASQWISKKEFRPRRARF
jgi:hypothetical protein